jgi:predicted amidohydrolase YtcJ
MNNQNPVRDLLLGILLAAAWPAWVTAAEPSQPADTVLVNGGLYTVDSNRSWAQAAALRDGRIVAVGTNHAVLALKGPKTEVIDLTGRMALPGFHDSHVHVMSAGVEQIQCPLTDLETVDAVLAAVKTCAESPVDGWVVGSGWNVALFPRTGPRKELLDEAVPGLPVILEDVDGHSAWVSSRALEIAGIDAHTPDPENGVIERDAKTGEPSGTVREAAMDLVEAHAPAPTAEMFRKGLKLALAHVRAAGITSFIEARVDETEFETFKALAQSHELTAKVRLSITYGMFGSDDFETLLARRDEVRGPRLNADSIKIFLDGVIEGETAALLEPYLTRPGYRGSTSLTRAQLNAAVTRFEAMGLQVHLHAIGDAATRAGLDAVAAARAKNGPGDRRHHMAHLQLIHPDDITRFAELGVAANFQSLWAFPDDDYIVKINLPQVGPERVNRMYPIGSIRRTGGRLVAGSDWSVSTVNPWPAIEVAITRLDPRGEGKEVLNPTERVDLATMIDAYTINGAWLVSQENETGSIEPGKAADIVVLDREVFSLPASELGGVRVDLTLLDGEVIYRRE